MKPDRIFKLDEVARWGDSKDEQCSKWKASSLIIKYARSARIAWSADVQGVERVLDIRLMLLWRCLCL